MSADRYEITVDGPCVTIKEPCGFSGEYHRSEYADNVLYGAIRQQARDIAELEVFAEIGRQWNADSSLAKWFPLTAERVDQDAQEIAKLRTDLAAAVAERDSYRDEFSGLCHALSVGSEGRPEMTAADWRKRVDDGVEFLLRPLIAQRDELVAAYEFARHVVRDDPGITPRGALIRQSDEIGRLRARLAAIDGAPTVCEIVAVRDRPHIHMITDAPPIGTQLIARPAKD